MFKIIALMGEAGSGKDTLMHCLSQKRPNTFNEIISCTTRPIREGEQHGINYFYLTLEEFNQKVKNNEMLEISSFNGWMYGVSLDALSAEKPNIGVFNPEGVRAMLAMPHIDLLVYRIICSDKNRLLRQLNRENNPNVDEIIRRYSTDKKDFSHLDFKYTEIDNNNKEDLELAAKAILNQLGL